MTRVVILGSAGAVNDATHDYTHFLLIGKEDTPVLVDAGSNPLGKIKNLGLDDQSIQDIILTHFHSDHVAGVPNMMMHMWLLGRKTPMKIYGLHHCINRIEEIMSAYGWEDWPNFFPVEFKRVSERDEALVLENKDFTIRSWPVKHFTVPTIGMRIENKRDGRVLAYSCDTEPCPAVIKIARNADILLHEAGGPPPGHSTARMAGEIATAAGAKVLYLIHYQVWNQDPERLVHEAKQTFAGPIFLARDYDEFEF